MIDFPRLDFRCTEFMKNVKVCVKRETGESPVRSRRCNKGVVYQKPLF